MAKSPPLPRPGHTMYDLKHRPWLIMKEDGKLVAVRYGKKGKEKERITVDHKAPAWLRIGRR